MIDKRKTEDTVKGMTDEEVAMMLFALQRYADEGLERDRWKDDHKEAVDTWFAAANKEYGSRGLHWSMFYLH